MLRCYRPLSSWWNSLLVGGSEGEGTCNLTLGETLPPLSSGTAKINTKWKVSLSCFKLKLYSNIKQQVQICLICSNSKWILLKSWLHKTLVAVFLFMMEGCVLYSFLSPQHFSCHSKPSPYSHLNTHTNTRTTHCLQLCPNASPTVETYGGQSWGMTVMMCACACVNCLFAKAHWYLQLEAVSFRACNCIQACMCICMVWSELVLSWRGKHAVTDDTDQIDYFFRERAGRGSNGWWKPDSMAWNEERQRGRDGNEIELQTEGTKRT